MIWGIVYGIVLPTLSNFINNPQSCMAKLPVMGSADLHGSSGSLKAFTLESGRIRSVGVHSCGTYVEFLANGRHFFKHNYKIYTYIYIHIHISLFTKLLRIHWKHNNNCNETTQLLWLQMHKPTHLDTPRREKMKWDYINEMKRDETRWNEIM